jgi:23S rRNA pseudouridine2605 synthase
MRRGKAPAGGTRRGGGARGTRSARAPHDGRFPTSNTHEPERLQKVLARAGLASRREVEAWIRAGRLTINGAPAALGVRVGPSDQVRLDGRLVRTPVASAAHAFLCHRSPGEPLTAPGAMPADERSTGTARELPAPAHAVARPAMLERLPRRAGRRFITVSPMPRVDGGLELVTSDGELAAQLQRAVHSLDSEFSVRVRGELAEGQLQGIASGALDSGAHVEVERCEVAGGEGANRWYTLTTRGASGKEVRQLFERQGALVSRVLRTRLGPLTLERSLARGQFRELTPEELRALMLPTGNPQA